MRRLGLVLLTVVGVFYPAEARWKPEYANAPQEVQDWYRNAVMTPQAQTRFRKEGRNWIGCCDHADRVKTKFKVSAGKDGLDEWFYLKPDGTWKRIPNDIIHWDQSGPNGEAILFAVGELETCFYPPESGN